MSTRLRCASPDCIGYFTPRHTLDTLCPQCVARAVDKERGEIMQDNGPVSDFISPESALTLVQCRIELAKTREELAIWKRFALSGYYTITAIAAPRQLLGNQKKIADRHLESCRSDFPGLLEEIEGPAYRRQG
jgi:hypothetical protein